MTECNQSGFEFAAHFSRRVVADFDGGSMATDGGGLLLRETDRQLNLLPRLSLLSIVITCEKSGLETLRGLGKNYALHPSGTCKSGEKGLEKLP